MKIFGIVLLLVVGVSFFFEIRKDKWRGLSLSAVVVFESLLVVLNKHFGLSDKIVWSIVFASLILFVSIYKLLPKSGSKK